MSDRQTQQQPPTRGGIRSLAATPGLITLLLTSLIARIALPFLGMGLLVHARQLSGSFAVGGLVTAAYAIAVGLGGPPAGRLVDRRGQTVVLVASAVASAALLFVIALLPARAPVVVLVSLAAGVGAVTPPVAACLRTALPELVLDPDQLRTAYAIDASANEATWVVGPPLGLALGAVWTPGAALAAGGVILLLGILGFAVQPASRHWRPAAAMSSRGGSLRSSGMRALVAVFLAVGVLFGAAEVGVTAAATLQGSAATASPLLALWGLGGVIGGVSASRFGGGARTPKGLVAILLALTATHTSVALTVDNLVVVAVVLVIAGATIAPAYATMYAIVEGAAPDGTLTEAFAWLATAGAVGGSLGAALAGVVIAHVGAAAVFVVAGAAGLAAVATTIVGACSLGSALRDKPLLPEPSLCTVAA